MKSRALLILVTLLVVVLPGIAVAETLVTIMTYNILAGGRPTDSRYGYDWYRLDEIIDLVSDVDPDILAIQEAHGWESDMEILSEALQMPYCAWSTAEEWGGSTLMLFSKFEVIEVEDWPDSFAIGAMRVAVQLPSEDVLQIFDVHLTPNVEGVNSTFVRSQETRTLIDLMEPYSNGLAVLVGDLNFRAFEFERYQKCPSCFYGETEGRIRPGILLSEAGWCLVASEDALGGLEQAWVPSAMQDAVQELEIGMENEELERLSDHFPIIVECALE